MQVTTYLSAAEAESAEMAGQAAVVIDLIRATTTIVEALAAGARAVYPTISTEEAVRLATSLGREDTLLCGERKGLMVSGFDLGNSPSEFTPERVAGRRLVMSTTNGTRAFMAAENASRVIAATLLNLAAVVRSLATEERVAIVCAGREGRFALDDALCAGILVDRLRAQVDSGGGDFDMDEGSRTVLALAQKFNLDLALLGETAAGAALIAVGLGDDLRHCAIRDCYDLVPEMSDRIIRLPGGAS